VINRMRLRAARVLRRPDQGSATLETILMIPILVFAFILIPATYHGVNAKLRLDEAAAQAARDATLATSPGQAEQAASQDIAQDLEGLGAACSQTTDEIDVGQLAPGSTVTVTLTCHTTAQAMAGLSLGANWQISATARSVVDQYAGS
jgi:Flp pilus assembly protein TadG